MKNRHIYIFIAASLAILVPTPGRFAYGLILVLLLNFMMAFGILFRKLIEILKLEEFQTVLISVFLIFLTIISKNIITFISPVMALVLSFAIFMPPVSAFMIGALYEKTKQPLLDDMYINMKETGYFSIIALLFYTFRDIAGYGTFTLPCHNGIKEFVLFEGSKLDSLGAFWASIPGALVLVSLLYILFNLLLKKMEIANNTTLHNEREESND